MSEATFLRDATVETGESSSAESTLIMAANKKLRNVGYKLNDSRRGGRVSARPASVVDVSEEP